MDWADKFLAGTILVIVIILFVSLIELDYRLFHIRLQNGDYIYCDQMVEQSCGFEFLKCNDNERHLCTTNFRVIP